MSPIPGMVLGATLLLLTWLDLVSPFVNEVSRWSKRGEANYEDRDWDEALSSYGRAAQAQPGGAREYNRGAAAYQGGKMEEALAAYQQAAGSKELDPGRLAYDLGNAKFKGGDYAGARDLYRQALRTHPNDEDARANFELAAKLAQAQQQQQQNQPQSKEGSPESDQESPSSPADSSRTNPSGGGSDQQDDQASKPETGDREPQENPDTGKSTAPPDSTQGVASEPKKMSPAEAQKLLNAVTPEERELLQARLKSAKKRRAEKDW